MDSQRIAATGGVSLHVLTAGLGLPGQPALLVHGLASNARLWDGVANGLTEQGHPVASVDQRGHGLSDKPDSGYDFETLTADLEKVMAALGWTERRPIVAGQSWGGNVVLELAARNPDTVGGLVLVDGGTIELANRFADWPSCEAALAPPPLTGTPAADFEKLIRSHHSHWPEAGIQATLANMEIQPDGTVRPWLSRDNHMKILRHLWEHHPSRLYPKISPWALLLMAEDPTNVRWMAGKRDEVARASKELPHQTTRWIPGDHDLHAEHPGLVSQLIHQAANGGLIPS